MKLYVADTHALYWHLASPEKLGAAARLAFSEAAEGEARVLLPAIVLAELFWILAKQGKAAAFTGILDALEKAVQFILVDLHIADLRDLEADSSVLELHDRLVVGVARRRGAILITKDREIVSAGLVPVAW